MTPSTIDWLLTEPTRIQVALATPIWKATMDLEYNALIQNNTWSLISPSPSLNVVGCKWIFSIKRNSNGGSIQRHKARLVAKGFHRSPQQFALFYLWLFLMVDIYDNLTSTMHSLMEKWMRMFICPNL